MVARKDSISVKICQRVRIVTVEMGKQNDSFWNFACKDQQARFKL